MLDDAAYACCIKDHEVNTFNEFIQSYAFMIDLADDLKETAFSTTNKKR